MIFSSFLKLLSRRLLVISSPCLDQAARDTPAKLTSPGDRFLERVSLNSAMKGITCAKLKLAFLIASRPRKCLAMLPLKGATIGRNRYSQFIQIAAQKQVNLTVVGRSVAGRKDPLNRPEKLNGSLRCWWGPVLKIPGTTDSGLLQAGRSQGGRRGRSPLRHFQAVQSQSLIAFRTVHDDPSSSRVGISRLLIAGHYWAKCTRTSPPGNPLNQS
jgi:hypothetical protein